MFRNGRRPTLPLVAPFRRVAKPALRRWTHAAASVGVSRTPVSRLVSRGVRRCADRVLLADAVGTTSGRVLVLTLITRLKGRAARKGRPLPVDPATLHVEQPSRVALPLRQPVGRRPEKRRGV